MERLQVLEEASNALGQTLQLYAGDSLDQAYSFVAPFVSQTGDYEELVGKMSDSDQTRLDFYLDQPDFTSWYSSMEDWTRCRAELEALRDSRNKGNSGKGKTQVKVRSTRQVASASRDEASGQSEYYLGRYRILCGWQCRCGTFPGRDRGSTAAARAAPRLSKRRVLRAVSTCTADSKMSSARH